jgi:hypothetical protein
MPSGASLDLRTRRRSGRDNVTGLGTLNGLEFVQAVLDAPP